MIKLNVEFFHDAICSFCYPMSYRMRQLAHDIPELHVVHRSFALAPDAEALAEQFGSHEQAKAEILTHWAHANQVDDLHRFNITGMEKESFLFPTSMKPLRAAKAAAFVGGDACYWDVFDALQKGLFTDHKNIEEEAVIFDLVRGCDLDFELWKQYYISEEVQEAVLADLQLAKQYGIHSVPSLVIDGTYLISGAQPITQLLAHFNNILEEKRQQQEQPIVLQSTDESGAACTMTDGKWQCDDLN